MLLLSLMLIGGPASAALNPGQSLDAAYDAAACGQVIELANGSWPAQTITGASGRCATNPVVFRTPPGVVATFNCLRAGESCLDVYASGVTFDGGAHKGIRTASFTNKGFSYQGRVDTERGATGITFQNMDIGAVAIGSNNSAVLDSDVGPSTDPLNVRFADGDGIRFERNLVHDFVITNGGHFECITWDVGTNVTVRDNEFRSCAIFGIFAKPIENISGVVERNSFWNPRHLVTTDMKYTLGSGANRCDVTVRDNWLSNGMLVDCPGVILSGNTNHSEDEQPPPRDGTSPPPPDPVPPPAGCDTACEQAYKDRIAVLNAEVARLQGKIDAALAELGG